MSQSDFVGEFLELHLKLKDAGCCSPNAAAVQPWSECSRGVQLRNNEP